jgi:DNA repair protein RecO
LRLAYLFAEMTDKLSGEHEHHAGLYELVAEAYSALHEGSPDTVLELWFKLRLLATLGYSPGLDGCVICAASGSGYQYAFNVELGGIVDTGCRSPGALPMSQPAIKLWRLLLTRPLALARQMDDMQQYATEGLDICNQFYDYTFGRRFKSSEILG